MFVYVNRKRDFRLWEQKEKFSLMGTEREIFVYVSRKRDVRLCK